MSTYNWMQMITDNSNKVNSSTKDTILYYDTNILRYYYTTDTTDTTYRTIKFYFTLINKFNY
jgi:hypothetical protein